MAVVRPPKAESELFNNIFGDVALEMDEYHEGDPVGVMACIIAAFSAAIGPQAKMETFTREMPLSFWPILCGLSGAGYKGAATGAAMAIVNKARPEFTETYVIEGFDSGLGMLTEMNDRKDMDSGKTLPLLVIDSEMSKLAKQTRSDQRLNVVLTQLFDGTPLVYKTGKDDIRIQEPHLAWIGNIQPEMWLETKGSKAAATGTWNRFFVIWVQRSKTLPTFGNRKRKAKYQEALTNAGLKLRRALAFAMNVDEIIVPEDVAETWESSHRLELDRMKRLSTGNQMERLEAYVLRLAALYCIFDQRVKVSVQDFDSALAFAKYAYESQHYIANNKEFVPRTLLATKVLDYVTEYGPAMFTAMTVKIGRAYNADGGYWRAIQELDGEVVAYTVPRKPGEMGKTPKWVTLRDAPLPPGAQLVDVAAELAKMGIVVDDEGDDVVDHPRFTTMGDAPEVVVEAEVVEEPETPVQAPKALPGPKPHHKPTRPSAARTEPPKHREGAKVTKPRRKPAAPAAAAASDPDDWF